MLLGFAEGADARRLWRLSAGARRRAVLGSFQRLFGRARRAPDDAGRAQLVGRSLDARLLRRIHAARRLERLRPGAARARRAASLGRDGDRGDLQRATWTVRSARASARPLRSRAGSEAPAYESWMWSASCAPGNGRVRQNFSSVASGTPSTPGVSDARPWVCGSSAKPPTSTECCRAAIAGDADQVQLQGACPSWSSRAAMIGSTPTL